MARRKTTLKRSMQHKPVNLETINSDPIIDSLKEHSQNNPSIRLISIDSQLLDQVALEGLCGLTLERLFRILDAIYPSLKCIKETNCQSFVWSILVNKFLRLPADAKISAFYLNPLAEASQRKTEQEPQEADGDSTKPSTTSSSQSKIIIDKEIKLPEPTVKRLAKSDTLLYPVQDGPIMGSCAKYLERVDISEKILEIVDKCKKDTDLLESMYTVNDDYGLENVYFVASQELRTRAILPNWSDPNVDIKLREYCALELIGRARTLGTIFPNDKTLGRYRIMLEAKGFITQFQPSMNSPIEHHLKRFSHARNQDKNFTPKRVKTFNMKREKRLAEKLQEMKNKENNKMDADGYNDDDIYDEFDDDDDDYDDDDEDDYNANNHNNELVPAGTSSKTKRAMLCCHPGKIKPLKSILQQLYDFIADSEHGVTQLDMRRELHLPKFHVRNHVKNLVSLEMICSGPPAGNSVWRVYFAPKSNRKRNRPKKVEELEKPAGGVMASWDQADLRAKKIIGHKRSSFNQAEDSLLILCRIASVLIDPKLKLSWCVHKRLIRDLLHRELVESHDKTSDACLRRIKYLKRLPNNIMSINELTAELQDDPDIKRLLKPTRFVRKPKKRFWRVLKCIRSKIPRLLGITGSTGVSSAIALPLSAPGGVGLSKLRLRQVNRSIISGAGDGASGSSGAAAATSAAAVAATTSLPADAPLETNEAFIEEINDHEELKQKYELPDCQSLASLQHSPTYDEPKNVVDVKFNQASLVTMAFTLSSWLDMESIKRRPRDGGNKSGANDGQLVAPRGGKRANQWLLDRFYSGYHDKLINSVISKLNKRTLLTRKCSAEQASLYKPRTKTTLKLNHSVLFLLNRYHSHSLLQLAQPISQRYKIDLSESNEMASIALLTSLCSLSSFNLDMKLRIPANVVGIDAGNENFKSLYERSSEGTRETLARFMSRCAAAATTATTTSAPMCAPSDATANNANETTIMAASSGQAKTNDATTTVKETTTTATEKKQRPAAATMGGGQAAKMDDSRRALFLLRHELKAQSLDKCGNLADCLIVQPCDVSFYSNRQLEANCRPLEEFLAKSKPLEPGGGGGGADEDQPHRLDKWLVRSHQLAPATTTTTAGAAAAATERPKSPPKSPSKSPPKEAGKARGAAALGGTNKEGGGGNASTKEENLVSGSVATAATAPDRERDLERRKRPVVYSARLWKRVDGSTHMASLFKLMESLLSWTIVFPGVERQLLELEFCHLMPREHLLELLDLMEQLELISGLRLPGRRPGDRRPRLFGFSAEEDQEEEDKAKEERIAYECTPGAYVKFCQLLNYQNHSAAATTSPTATAAAAASS